MRGLGGFFFFLLYSVLRGIHQSMDPSWSKLLAGFPNVVNRIESSAPRHRRHVSESAKKTGIVPGLGRYISFFQQSLSLPFSLDLHYQDVPAANPIWQWLPNPGSRVAAEYLQIWDPREGGVKNAEKKKAA